MKKIAIIGDNCVDAYWVGKVSGVSAEAPVPVVKQSSLLAFPGMAGNVQKLLGDLGGVQTQLIIAEGGSLPTKNRLVTEEGTQLARWDVDDYCTPLSPEEFTRVERDGWCPDALIVCDYGKGAISPYVVSRLRTYAEAGIPLFVDTKGDPFTWLGVDATLFPNQHEFAQWQSHYEWMPSVVLKRSSDGIAYLRYGDELMSLPAEARQVRNVCGAGDAVIAAFTWGAVVGAPIAGALSLANRAAASLVERDFDRRGIDITVKKEASA